MLSRILVLFVALLCCPVVFAQTPLTLIDAVASFDHSPEFQIAHSSAEEAGYKRAEAFSGLLPTVSASGQHLLDKKYMLIDVPGFPTSIPTIIPTTIYTLGFTWTLFDGFANVERYHAALEQERASKKDFEWTKFTGTRDVVLSFYRALGAQILSDVAESNLKALQEHLNDAQQFRKAGISTRFEVLQVEVQASSAKSAVMHARDELEISKLHLAELLGQDLKSRKITGVLPKLDETAITTLQADIKDRGDLQALEHRVESADDLSGAAHKHWLPKVALKGETQYYNNRDDTFSGDRFRNAYSLGVQLTWTYDGLIGPFARAGAASEEKYQAERKLELARLRASNEIESWRRRYLYSVSVYKDREDDIVKATESVRLARQGRQAGTRTNTELLDAEAELFRARAQSVEAQLGAIEALLNLETATGQVLYRFF
jgi:outer membrane protein TolC